MKIKILAFGIAREIIGERETWMEVTDTLTTEQLRNQLNTIYPQLGVVAGYAIAVNENYVTKTLTLQANDTVAVIPPVSGG